MTIAIARQVTKITNLSNYNTHTNLDYVAVRALCAFTDARRIDQLTNLKDSLWTAPTSS